MSHWHRLTRAMSVKTLLIRSKLRFIFDHGLPVELATCLPQGASQFTPQGLLNRLHVKKSQNCVSGNMGFL